jgi:hypothetical protein
VHDKHWLHNFFNHAYFKTCLHTQIDKNKLPLKCKFALQAALEKIEQIEKLK